MNSADMQNRAELARSNEFACLDLIPFHIFIYMYFVRRALNLRVVSVRPIVLSPRVPKNFDQIWR